jgi:2-polyprenyl-3-methyl-5-hydroxy-6-metoxy-1,4-benzoquinol methylase
MLQKTMQHVYGKGQPHQERMHCRREAQAARPLQGLSILDVGCGGGLFAEALARLGAAVTGIDASEASVRVAAAHAAVDPALAARLEYRNITAEQAFAEGAPQLLLAAL